MSANTYTAVLIDTVSIQKYIFGSNRLKENIGASYIIEHLLFRELLPKVAKAIGLDPSLDIEAWKAGNYRLEQDENARIEIGYIGGGNTQLIFRDEGDARGFITAYSELVLTHFPGIRVAFGIDEKFEYEGTNFRESRKRLSQSLATNKSMYPVMDGPYKPGIVEDCALSNEGQETTYSKEYANISHAASVRLQAGDAANRAINTQYASLLGSDFTFSLDQGELGQPDDKGYIAIVHADGNGIGKKFMKCESLAKVRILSQQVASLADAVMDELIEYVVEKIADPNMKEGGDKYLTLHSVINKTTKEKRHALPIRPILAGGDDITFVCEGRIGLHLAEKLLEYMTNAEVDGEKVSACAGVSIVHTKYPFYRAYHLAEKLMEKAKAASRKRNDSWINYYVSTGGFAGELDHLMERQYETRIQKSLPAKDPENEQTGETPNKDTSRVSKGALTLRPYCVTVHNGSRTGFSQLKKGCLKMNFGEKINGVRQEPWPKNKVKQMRDILRQGRAAAEYFKIEMEARDLSLPEITSIAQDKQYHHWQSDLWEWIEHGRDSRKSHFATPYYDMVELADFYPVELLDLNT